MSISDPQYKKGLIGLRARYIARALDLTNDSAFRQQLRDLRIAWNGIAPDFPIHLAVLPDILQRPEEARLFYPDRLYEKWRQLQGEISAAAVTDRERWNQIAGLIEDWEAEIIWKLCPQYFPREPFWNPLRPKRSSPVGIDGADHPAGCFLSACLLFDMRSANRSIIEPLFSEMRIEARSTSFPPSNGDIEWHRARYEHEAKLLRDVVSELLADDPERVNAIIESARRESRSHASEILRAQRPKSDQDRFWYVEIGPYLNRTDWRNAEPIVADVIRSIYGLDPGRGRPDED